MAILRTFDFFDGLDKDIRILFIRYNGYWLMTCVEPWALRNTTRYAFIYLDVQTSRIARVETKKNKQLEC